jgi:hypothetical protein
LPSARSNVNEDQQQQPPRATVFMSPNVSTFTFTNAQANQENSPTSEKINDKEDDGPTQN